MDDNTSNGTLPERLQRAAGAIVTVLAAVLYAVVLGSAIVRTAIEGEPIFSEMMLRMASLLSGLVGSVVAAGFARSRRPSATPIVTTHPIGGGIARTGWYSLRPPSRFQAKFLGVAAMVGVRVQSGAPTLSDVYFVVGVGAFLLTITRATVPELVSNAAWVWLGTIVTSTYTYFGMDVRT
jgi:hypothetical protein